MGFWVFVFLITLLIPLSMVGFGRLFLKSPPKEISSVFEYRTPMATKNRETWTFAQRYFGRLYFWIGIPLLAFSVLPMLLILGAERETIGNLVLAVTAVQCLCLLAPIGLTERALKQNFNKNGFRKK